MQQPLQSCLWHRSPFTSCWQYVIKVTRFWSWPVPCPKELPETACNQCSVVAVTRMSRSDLKLRHFRGVFNFSDKKSSHMGSGIIVNEYLEAKNLIRFLECKRWRKSSFCASYEGMCGSEVMAPIFLSLDTGWRWNISLTSHLIYSQALGARYPLKWICTKAGMATLTYLLTYLLHGAESFLRS